ncbi:MAG: transcriptional regulator [Acidobacteria bacterium]|nr:transcriptional regulator [Acidobacteriota bacterium]MBI3425757.1 transcriptional regulator [Acidobacteriota bacterium]
MTAPAKRINKAKYAALLSEVLPRPIQSEAENERALKVVDRLMSKGEDKLTAEEGVLLELLIQLIERFEEQHYAIPEAPSHRVLQTLMENRNLKQKDLLPIFGSKGIASEVINGKRAISKEQAKKLGEFFKLSPAAFI